jgi:hypothetical protein
MASSLRIAACGEFDFFLLSSIPLRGCATSLFTTPWTFGYFQFLVILSFKKKKKKGRRSHLSWMKMPRSEAAG